MPNLGYKIRHKEGYFPVAPADTQQDIRTEMCLVMERRWASRSSGSTTKWPRPGQAEIDYRFDTLVKAADAMMVYKYVVKNVAGSHGKTASFHAQAALWRQRLGHAHPPVAVEEGQAALCRQRVCRA